MKLTLTITETVSYDVTIVADDRYNGVLAAVAAVEKLKMDERCVGHIASTSDMHGNFSITVHRPDKIISKVTEG